MGRGVLPVLAVVWLCMGVVQLVTAAPAAAEKKLIQFGWDEPNTRYLRANIERMERQPFDGVVFNARYFTAAGEDVIFADNGWSSTLISWESLAPALTDLQQTAFGHFTDNFLRVNVEPGTVDWFDDFSGPIANLTAAARLAFEGGTKGVFFDLEPYGFPIFQYSRQSARDAHSFDEYAAQVRKRGRQIMTALQAGYPKLTLFLTFGYGQADPEEESLQRYRYGLLRYFLDGLLAGAEEGTVIIDGFEGSYSYRTAKEFADAYQWIYGRHRELSSVRSSYDGHVNAAFGLWMDYGSDAKPWQEVRTERNYFSPRRLQRALGAALRRSDHYVWLYSQQPSWWSNRKLPEAYVRAVTRAKNAAQPRQGSR